MTDDLIKENNETMTSIIHSGTLNARLSVYFTPMVKGSAAKRGQPKYDASLKEMAAARKAIFNAKNGILFLMFDPGLKHTLLNDIESRLADKNLHIHGVVNTASRITGPTLYKRGEKLETTNVVIPPSFLGEGFSYWKKEKAGNLVKVHSKVIIIDPFGDHPVVVTGSHNLGSKASDANDENMVIIENHPDLAAAYSVNIINIFNHYLWRHKTDDKKWAGLTMDDTWQDKYKNNERKIESKFWL